MVQQKMQYLGNCYEIITYMREKFFYKSHSRLALLRLCAGYVDAYTFIVRGL